MTYLEARAAATEGIRDDEELLVLKREDRVWIAEYGKIAFGEDGKVYAVGTRAEDGTIARLKRQDQVGML